MAGTDRTQNPMMGGPVVVLVEPQLAENIGAAARAMLNFGLTELRLVAPRDGWPNDTALAMASGADTVVTQARLFPTLAAAVADLSLICATTARRRDMEKPILHPAEAAQRVAAVMAQGGGAGFVFGPERAGLTNDALSLADVAVVIPANPRFASLNLAQAVLIMGYVWFQTRQTDIPVWTPKSPPASKADLYGLFEHLESELDIAGFLYPPAKRPAMIRNIRNMIERAHFTEQDVRTLRGIIKALTGTKGLARRK